MPASLIVPTRISSAAKSSIVANVLPPPLKSLTAHENISHAFRTEINEFRSVLHFTALGGTAAGVESLPQWIPPSVLRAGAPVPASVGRSSADRGHPGFPSARR